MALPSYFPEFLPAGSSGTADAAFAKPELYEILAARDVKYALRISSNDALEHAVAELLRRPVGRASHSRRFGAHRNRRLGTLIDRDYRGRTPVGRRGRVGLVLPPTGKPFAPGHDPRRNAGGRPRGLAAQVRQAVGDGEDLVDFMAAVLNGDTKRLRVKNRTPRTTWISRVRRQARRREPITVSRSTGAEPFLSGRAFYTACYCFEAIKTSVFVAMDCKFYQ